MSLTTSPGDILTAQLPLHIPRGHEQQGYRPVLVIGDITQLAPLRYPMVLVVPLSSQVEAWTRINPEYLVLPRGAGGLPTASVVLLEHARGVDEARLLRRLGRLTSEAYTPIRERLTQLLGVA